MKILTVVGARPQFIKAAALSPVLRKHHEEIIVHTGQHYDANMSASFFSELDIPKPEYNLDAGGGTHAEQTAKMLIGVQGALIKEQPDFVLVYGDTNSTLAGALAASKLETPIIHVEAGLRSFNRNMPEEVNRVLVDHISSLLLCPSELSACNLAKEGIVAGVHIVGDLMADILFKSMNNAETSGSYSKLGIQENEYYLATVHRSENTDNPNYLNKIIEAFSRLSSKIVFVVHPRTKKKLDSLGVKTPKNVIMCDPLGYLDMVALMRNAKAVLTDSGGLQKEAYWIGKPCITLRNETEWMETVELGWNTLVGSDPNKILAAVENFVLPINKPCLYGGDGSAAERICSIIHGQCR